MAKRKTYNILKDPKHWIGWAISTVMIILVMRFTGIHIMTIIRIVALFITIVVVDFLKHKVNLQ